MIKTTGAEFKRFYSDATTWPDDVWHDDECVHEKLVACRVDV